MSHPAEAPRAISAKKAGSITLAGQLMKAAVQLVGLVAFSHILTPRDVGLIAMLSVFIYLGELIRDFGLSQAAIQTATLTHAQATNLFWTNTVVGIAMTLTLCLAAPLVAHLYGEPALLTIAPWIALTFTINALQAQFQVWLARHFRFVTLTLTDVSSQFVGLVAGLAAAASGAGYWALVVQMLIAYLSLLIQRACCAHWWPGLPSRNAHMSSLYLFGVHSGLAQLVQYAASNVDSLTIGMRWGAGALGVYNRAFQMFSVPGNQLLTPLTNVALPLLSRRRHDGHDFYPLLWKAQVVLSTAFTFLFVLSASLSKPLVHIALGPAWHQSASLLSILSIGGAMQVLSFTAFWAFLASGNARQLLLHQLVTKPLLAGAIIVGAFNGVTGVAWGYTVGLTISWFISLAWLKKCDNMPIATFLRSGIHVILSGVLSGGATYLIAGHLYGQINALTTLVIGILLASCLYFPLVFASRSARQLTREILRPAAANLWATFRKGGGEKV